MMQGVQELAKATQEGTEESRRRSEAAWGKWEPDRVVLGDEEDRNRGRALPSSASKQVLPARLAVLRSAGRAEAVAM